MWLLYVPLRSAYGSHGTHSVSCPAASHYMDPRKFIEGATFPTPSCNWYCHLLPTLFKMSPSFPSTVVLVQKASVYICGSDFLAILSLLGCLLNSPSVTIIMSESTKRHPRPSPHRHTAIVPRRDHHFNFS